VFEKVFSAYDECIRLEAENKLRNTGGKAILQETNERDYI